VPGHKIVVEAPSESRLSRYFFMVLPLLLDNATDSGAPHGSFPICYNVDPPFHLAFLTCRQHVQSVERTVDLDLALLASTRICDRQ
jgi:hypothetical protein